MNVGTPPDSGAGAADESGMVRTYKVWKGSNVFFLRGRLIFGPDVRSVFLTIFLVVGPVAVFCVFVARKLIHGFPHDLGILIMVVVIALTLIDLILLLVTSGRDPGIIARNAHPPGLEGDEGNTGLSSGQTLQLHLPRTKDVVVNGVVVKIKYCDTCMLYRPPRCSHCSICNNCVEKFDHHCPWVGQCIGLRNYRSFFMFIFCSTLLCIYVHVFCWVYIRRIMNAEKISIWKAMTKTPASIALIIYSFASVWFVGGLTAFHSYLISKNQSTYENFRYRYNQHPNPYNKGVIKNFMEVFCTSIPPSKNNFREKIPKEQAITSRRVTGRCTSPNIRKPLSDMEMGRLPARNEVVRESDEIEGAKNNDDNVDKNGRSANHKPDDLSRVLAPEGMEGRSISHHVCSSDGIKSESRDMSSLTFASVDGESKRGPGSNNGNLSRDNQPAQTNFEA